MRRIVIKIGGHLIFSRNIETDRLKEIINVIEILHNENIDVKIIIGGGESARKYIEAAGIIGLNEFDKDFIGIMTTWINAFIIASALGEIAYKPIPRSIEEVLTAINFSDKILVCGGLIPGQSTMSVTAIIAEAVKADLIIDATDVEGVYTSDPKKDPNAKFLREVTTLQLKKILETQKSTAGEYKLIEDNAIKIVERSRIPLRIINGLKVENIIKAARGEDVGTLIMIKQDKNKR